MTSAEVLETCRLLAERLDLVGADLVEVAPMTFGTADITALLAGSNRSRDTHGHRAPTARFCIMSP